MKYDGEIFLVRPGKEHKKQYEAMMDEWETEEGRLNPGALRRFSNSKQEIVTYEEWLKWIEDDRQAGQDLYFFTNGEIILGAISMTKKCRL